MLLSAALLLASWAAPAAAAPSCRAAFLKLDPAPPVSLSSATAPAVAAVQKYALCLAVARRDVAACDMLKSYAFDPSGGFTGDPRRECVEHASEQLFARAALETGPAGLSDCRAAASAGRLTPPDNVARACGLVAARPRRPEQLCAGLASLAGKDVDGCPLIFGALDSGPDVCAGARNPHEAARCLDLAVFGAAARAKDPAKCGASRVCRLLLEGRPKLCADLARAAADAACGK